MKCDGVRPTCTPCLRAERTDDCEYADSHRRPRTLVLEEDIARLRARVEELEHPRDPESAVELHAPYVADHGSVRHVPLQVPLSADSSRALIQSDVRRSLVVIAPHATELGLFLNIDRLRARGTYILRALHSALTLWSVHISDSWEEKQSMECQLLSQAQNQLSDALATSNMEPDPQFFMHILQSSVLLSYYMQRIGQPLGARYHASSALSLAFTLRLHTSCGQAEPSITTMTMTTTTTSTNLFDFVGYPELGTPVDAVEEKERVDGFWTVYALEKWLGAVYGGATPTAMNDGGVGITTAWPGSTPSSSIEAGNGRSDPNTNTVVGFLRGRQLVFANEDGLALQAKAAVLLGEAASVAASFDADPTISQSPVFRNRFTDLDALIQRFVASLFPLFTAALASLSSIPKGSEPSLVQAQAQAQVQAQARQCLLTINIAALAQVTLHRPFAGIAHGSSPSRRRCVDGALGAVRALERGGCLGVVSPVHSIIWTALCLVLHDEVLCLRHAARARQVAVPGPPSRSGSVRQQGLGGGDVEDAEAEAEVVSGIRKLARALNEVSQSYPSRFFVANFEALLPVLESIAV